MKTAKQTTAGEVKPRSGPRAKRIESTGSRFTISNELWALMEPLLPEHKNTHRFGGGRPRVPDRPCADGIFFLLSNRLPVERLVGHRHLPQLDGPRPLSGLGPRRLLSALLAGGAG